MRAAECRTQSSVGRRPWSIALGRALDVRALRWPGADLEVDAAVWCSRRAVPRAHVDGIRCGCCTSERARRAGVLPAIRALKSLDISASSRLAASVDQREVLWRSGEVQVDGGCLACACCPQGGAGGRGGLSWRSGRGRRRSSRRGRARRAACSCRRCSERCGGGPVTVEASRRRRGVQRGAAERARASASRTWPAAALWSRGSAVVSSWRCSSSCCCWASKVLSWAVAVGVHRGGRSRRRRRGLHGARVDVGDRLRRG